MKLYQLAATAILTTLLILSCRAAPARTPTPEPPGDLKSLCARPTPAPHDVIGQAIADACKSTPAPIRSDH